MTDDEVFTLKDIWTITIKLEPQLTKHIGNGVNNIAGLTLAVIADSKNLKLLFVNLISQPLNSLDHDWQLC